MDVEAPAEPHDRELDQDQPEAARDEKTADLPGAATLGAVQKGGNPGQEDESRRAEMRRPARQTQRRVGDVARIEAAIGKKMRVWSSAITIMTRPRSVSIELSRVRALVTAIPADGASDGAVAGNAVRRDVSSANVMTCCP